MTARLDAVREADVVVLGAGAAGLSVALGLAGRRVDLAGQGSARPHRQQPVGAGRDRRGGGTGRLAGASRRGHPRGGGGARRLPAAVARLTQEGPERLAELLALGARFDRDADGQLDLGREAAHSRARVLHARDATGAEVVRALGGALAGTQRPERLRARVRASSWCRDGGRVAGVLARHADGALVLHRARAVVLATGGIGRVFARTTNPPEATGDGLALAWRAGARLADLEFVQFHPTALDVGADPMPLLTEALRGRGRRSWSTRTGGGSWPMPDRRRRAAAARRRRAGALVRARVGPACASWTRARRWARPSPSASRPCSRPAARHGLDPRREPIPVAPAAHYHMGGVDVDLDGRELVAGLWAAGEVACTGVHGANRLASNSLLEALVFGARVARCVGEAVPHLRRPSAVLHPLTTDLGAAGDEHARPSWTGSAG